jgi:hypothetical protein
MATKRPAPTVITVDAEAITMAAPRGVVARATALSSRRSSLVAPAIVCEFGFAGSTPAVRGWVGPSLGTSGGRIAQRVAFLLMQWSIDQPVAVVCR